MSVNTLTPNSSANRHHKQLHSKQFKKNVGVTKKYNVKKTNHSKYNQKNSVSLNSKSGIESEIKELETRIALECPSSLNGILNDDEKENEKIDPNYKGPELTISFFSDLPISNRTLRGLKAAEFFQLTKIQKLAIPLGLKGLDVLGEAQTGSGKTLAFVIPIIENLYRRRWEKTDGLGALIISPIRELAAQIFDVLKDVGRFHDFSAACLIGGKHIKYEINRLSEMTIIVSTPGRLLQHLDESAMFDVSALQMLVVDEADQLVSMGFSEVMSHIIDHLPDHDSRQTFLFSATLSSSVQRLALISLKEAVKVSVQETGIAPTPERLKQTYLSVNLSEQIELLFSFLRTHSQKRVIVFVNSCKQVRFLYESFKILKPGSALFELHGRQNQQKRLDVFQHFCNKSAAACLLCTDIAARGIDFPSIDWVLQLNCPPDVETYVHRVGRTARYRSSGCSVLFLLPSEKLFLKRLAEKNICPTQLYISPRKIVRIKSKLGSLVASNQELKHLAQRAFVSYIRSITLATDSEVFNISDMLGAPTSQQTELFAQSLGLNNIPEGVENELIFKKKKQKVTKLERLKEKIKENKQKKLLLQNNGISTTETIPDESWCSSNDDTELKQLSLSKSQKRLKRLQLLRTTGEITPSIQSPSQLPIADDLLIPVSKTLDSSTLLHDLHQHLDINRMKKKLRPDRIKIRADGTAKIKGLAMLSSDTHGYKTHTFFNDNEDNDVCVGKTAFEQLVEEMNSTTELCHPRDPTTLVEVSAQTSHLTQLRERLLENKDTDKLRHKERIHQQHLKKRERERAQRQSHQDCPPIVSLETTVLPTDSDHEDITEPVKSKKRKVISTVADLEGEALHLLSL